ncbi:hypothetical protein ALC60_07153 [Trachymyrmex zeteki]|uniref:Uncharacterized protein n=1 Tax=Mycetomoellerius zeteki TaxID=64791 RepID=A0A151X0N6_9HYME|nr:hypothetical protein ALC60_07153 [Trachymyrmex zeteki]
MNRLEENRLKAIEKRRKIKRKSSRRGENRKGFLLRGAPYQQYRYISHSAKESNFTTRQRRFLILHFLAIGFNVKANAGFPRICCIATRVIFDCSSCCINNALYRITFSSPLDLPRLKSPELFQSETYHYLYLLQHLSSHSFPSVSKDQDLVENFVVVHLALDFAAFSSFCYSHIFLRMKKNLTYSISIVDEGIVLIISCAQVHVIIILVPFLSHGRGSLKQREIINCLSILLQRSDFLSSTYIFCLKPSCHVFQLILIIVIVEWIYYASKRSVARSRTDLVIHNQIAFYLTSLSASLSLIYKKFRSIRENKPPPTVSYSPVERTPNQAIDPVCDVVIDDRELVVSFLFCTNTS